MVRVGEDGVRILFKELMVVVYGRRLGWGGIGSDRYIHFDAGNGSWVWFCGMVVGVEVSL